MNALKHKRENKNVFFHCNDISQRSKIWYYKKANFQEELAPAQNQGRKLIYLDNFEQKSLSHLILSFFSRPSPHHPTFFFFFYNNIIHKNVK